MTQLGSRGALTRGANTPKEQRATGRRISAGQGARPTHGPRSGLWDGQSRVRIRWPGPRLEGPNEDVGHGARGRMARGRAKRSS